MPFYAFLRFLFSPFPRFYIKRRGALDSSKIKLVNFFYKTYLNETTLFQNLYLELVSKVGQGISGVLESMSARSSTINLEKRVTGDGLVWITEEILLLKEKLPYSEIQEAIDVFIQDQSLLPKKRIPIPETALKGNSLKTRLLKKISKNLELYKESI